MFLKIICIFEIYDIWWSSIILKNTFLKIIHHYCHPFTQGPNHTMSLDGHDKLCGYQKSMFPLSIYGGQDAFSGKMCFLRIWTTNNSPMIVGRHYFEYVAENKGIYLIVIRYFSKIVTKFPNISLKLKFLIS